MTLAPAPSTLGLHSPELGKWFEVDDDASPAPSLPAAMAAPGADLNVQFSLPNDVDWHAPTHGTRSWFVADSPRPAGLARYRNAAGTPAFTDGNVVVLFELWPDAELRLHTLTATLPRIDGTTGTDVPTRPRVHALAFEFAATTIAAIDALHEDYPGNVDTDDKKLDYLGLVATATGLASAADPTPELRVIGTDSSVLVQNRSGSALGGFLWAFDHQGRPIDPGAVAAWWSRLATTDWNNLWSSTTTADQRTAPVATARTVHLVDAHEGPLPADHLARLTPTNLTAFVSATNVLSMSPTGTTAPTFSLSPAPTTDDAPIPRLALLPHGAYGTIAAPDNAGTTALSGWPGTATPPLTRDFARLAFVDVEEHLVGLDRTDSDQADVDLRLSPAVNTAATPFAATTDEANAAILSVLSGSAAVVMSPVMDPDWGPSEPTDLSSGDVDTVTCTVHAIAGAGRTEGSESVEQLIAVTFDEQLPPDAWVRVWSHGFDTTTGRQFRTDGGGGRADGDGTAHLVVPIADGAAGRSMTLDLIVVNADDRRFIGGERFRRPDLIAGDPVALPDSPGGVDDATVWICEQGTTLDRSAGTLRSGDTLLAVPDDVATGTFALVDETTLADSDYVADTLRSSVGSGDRLVVTVPAFGPTDDGELTAPIDDETLVEKTRVVIPSNIADIDEFSDWVGLGNPIPSMERREVASADEATDVAAIGTTPGRGRNHEHARSQDGHPGVVASDEIHGTGVSLAGPAAHRMVGLLRERAYEDLGAFAEAATTIATPAAAPTGAGPQTWAVVLETIARDAAGDPALRAFVDAFPNFTPGDTWENTRTAIENVVNGLPGVTGFSILGSLGTSLTTAQATQLARAIDQLILTTRDGRQQGATAIASAIGRAQDFVYIETPAIDDLTADGGDIDLVGALTARLAAVPSLTVLVCVPGRFLPGQPSALEAMRRNGVAGALHALDADGGDRVTWFAPTAGPDRHLHMSSMTVVIDDAVLVTGTTHLWRRGLTFDSSLACALFDEDLTEGRPTLVRLARRRLLAERLGIDVSLVSDDPTEMARAARLVAARGGLGRIDTGAYAPAARVANEPEDSMWLPDGSVATDWFVLLAALLGQTDEDNDDFIR